MIKISKISDWLKSNGIIMSEKKIIQKMINGDNLPVCFLKVRLVRFTKSGDATKIKIGVVDASSVPHVESNMILWLVISTKMNSDYYLETWSGWMHIRDRYTLYFKERDSKGGATSVGSGVTTIIPIGIK